MREDMRYIRPYHSGDGFSQFEEGYREGKLYYIALAGKELIGYICYRKLETAIRVEAVESGGDDDLFDGLMRAVFDAAVNIGIEEASFAPEVDRAVLDRLKVPMEGDGCVKSLSEFLRNCKKCKMY